MLVALACLPASAAEGTDLALAIDVPAADIVLATSTGSAVASTVLANYGAIVPYTLPDLALFATGRAEAPNPQPGSDLGPFGEAGDRAALELDLLAPTDAFRFEVRIFFLSSEYAEWVGSDYNDVFHVDVTGPAWSGDAAVDDEGLPISVNSAFFGVTSAEALDGTGYETEDSYYTTGSGLVGAGSGWLTIAVPVSPGVPLNVEFSIADVGDGTLDSAVVIDDWRWSDVPIDEPAVIAPPAIDWLTPKRGPVEGGVTTQIRGRNFDPSCFAVFDGVLVDEVTFVDSHRIDVVTPPNNPGLVDITIDCEDGETHLTGGFTYYDTLPDGAEALDIRAIVPGSLPVEGGTIEITAEGLVTGSSVVIDGTAAAATVIDEVTLSVVAPPRVAGVVDVSVRNPDGQVDVRVGGLFYMDESLREPEDTGAVTPPVGEPGCGCDGVSAPAGFAVMLLALVRRRR